MIQEKNPTTLSIKDIMNENELLSSILLGRREIGVKSNKFVGALTSETLKRVLEGHGIPVSPRDVFIRGIGIEIDLVVPKRGKEPRYGLMYEPDDVIAVLEIKTTGAFSKGDVDRVRSNFESLRKIAGNIYCAYVTLTERKTYAWKITSEKLGFPAFTIAWHTGNYKTFEFTGDFERLLKELQRISG